VVAARRFPTPKRRGKLVTTVEQTRSLAAGGVTRWRPSAGSAAGEGTEGDSSANQGTNELAGGSCDVAALACAGTSGAWKLPSLLSRFQAQQTTTLGVGGIRRIRSASSITSGRKMRDR
jgi:hypothetical protein